MKRLLIFLVGLLFILPLSGCKRDSMEDITIYTTTYPIEYITNRLYGNHSDVNSIYPNEVIKLSDKLVKDYSESDLFVYNGLSHEKDYAVSMLNNNKNLKIVDATMGMEYESSIEELWLDPSNFLMLCLNIRNGMKEYITNGVLRKQIDENYEKIKLDISELDADIKLLVENANDNHLLVGNNSLQFLEKYNVEVYSVDSNNTFTESLKNDIQKQITNKHIKYIIMFSDDVLTEEVEEFLNNNNIETLYFDSLKILTIDNKNSEKDFISIMNDNLSILRQELYEE